MLTVLLGIIIAFVLVCIYAKFDHYDVAEILSYIAAFTFLGSIFLGIVYPISGYKEWELKKEVELVSLSNGVGTEGTLFVTTSNGEYSYRYEIDSEFGTSTSKEYKVEVLSSKNVEEVEDPNCTKAYLYTYERKGKKTIWTFSLLGKEKKYVFYVPEGTIRENIELK